jgi:hypothetical protein
MLKLIPPSDRISDNSNSKFKSTFGEDHLSNIYNSPVATEYMAHIYHTASINSSTLII